MMNRIGIFICVSLLSIIATYGQAIVTDFTYDGVIYDGIYDGTCSTTAGVESSWGIRSGNHNITGNLVLPDTVTDASTGKKYILTEISTFSFYGGTEVDKQKTNNITSVVIPNSATYIGRGAFCGNPLKKLVLGKNIKTIESLAFAQIYTNPEVYIFATTPPALESDLGTKTVHVPYGYLSKYQGHYQWKGYSIIDDADIVVIDNIIYKYDDPYRGVAKVIGVKSDDIVKAEIQPTILTITGKELPVTEIAAEAFMKANLQEVVIPNSVTTIGEKAFCQCENLEKLNLGNSVEQIKALAFFGCNLSYLGIPSSVKEIGQNAFASNGNLSYVLMGKGLKTIGESAFAGCENLKEVEIDDIASWCAINFADIQANPMCCSQNFSIRGKVQTSLTIPSGVKKINPFSFAYCKSIKSLTLAESVEEICSKAFYDSGLERIDGTANVAIIGKQAFAFCNDLFSVNLSQNLKTIGDYAFSDCFINSIVVEGGLETVGEYAFKGCVCLSTIDTGDGLGEIGAGAFSGCEELEIVKTSSISNWCNQKFFEAI